MSELQKDQVQYALNCNQSYLRLTLKNQFQILNVVYKRMLAVKEANPDEFFMAFREKADDELKRVDFERPGPIWAKVNGILNRASFLASKQLGDRGEVGRMVDALALKFSEEV